MNLYSIIIYPLELIIEFSFRLFLDVFKKTGIAVLGVSFAVSILCLPLYVIAEKWQQLERDTQKKLKPGIQRIKDVFKGDEQYMILSTFYKQNHYHPLMALRSSFGLLIQVPFFIAAYAFLSNCPSLQNHDFLFIRNMGQPDALFTISGFAINVLPIAMTIINCIAGAIYTKGFALKDKLQIYGMALLFLVILYNSPAGLVLYWTMNNIFSLVKNVFYKFKNPLKAFLICTVVAILLMDFYVLFVHHGATGRRILMAGCMTALLLIPFVLKIGSWLLDNIFADLLKNSKERFTLFIISAVAIWLLSGLLLPTLLIGSSVTEFSDIDSYASPLFFIKNTCLQSFGFTIFWPLCIYFLFSKRVQATISILSVITLFTAVLNAFFFSNQYGTLTRMITFADGLSTANTTIPIIINLLIVLAIIFFVALQFKLHLKPVLNAILFILPLTFLVMSVITNNQIRKDYKEYRDFVSSLDKQASSVEPVLNFSKTGKNVVVLMIDRAESAYVESIFDEFPELKDVYSGFTFYPNTISFGGHTLFGAPPLFGGYEYTPTEMSKRNSEKMLDKNNQALKLLPRIFTEQSDFSATVTDASWANYSWIPDMSIFNDVKNTKALLLERNYTSIWISENPDKIKPNIISSAIKRNLLFFCLFKMSPMIFRDVLYDEGLWWSSDTDTGDIQEFIDFYSVLDYMPQLTNYDATGNQFFSMVNDTTHSNLKLQPPLYEPAVTVTGYGTGKLSKASGYSGNAAAFRLLGEWIQALKDNGVYDNTRLIIVSDHGIGNCDGEKESFKEDFYDDFLRDHLHPVLFYKDFNQSGSIKTDMTFMTTADVPLLALKNIVQNPVNPYTNKELTDETKFSEGAIVSSFDSWSPGQHGTYTFKIPQETWYTVKDNIFDINNWKKGIGE